jgi:hypothetical protein
MPYKDREKTRVYYQQYYDKKVAEKAKEKENVKNK